MGPRLTEASPQRLRYRFSGFVVSTARRQLLRDGREVPLIPRYFDLLVLLLERRHEAVHRRQIFDRVWSDAVVSDGALSQAVRTLRRALGDDVREPRFLRTVSRHGYQFVWPEVACESDDAAPSPLASAPPPAPSPILASALRAAAGGALAGLLAGGLGGLALWLAPGASLPTHVPVSLAVFAAIVGGVGALGVGLGIGVAERFGRRWRTGALVALGSAGGAAIGELASLVGRATIEALFGLRVDGVGGGLEGAVMGAAAGLGYAFGVPESPDGGPAFPIGAARLRACAVAGACCAAAAVALGLAGGRLGGLSIDSVARTFPGSRVGLAPFARLLGESNAGRLTAATTGAYEGLCFGFGLLLGLTRPPRRVRPEAADALD